MPYYEVETSICCRLLEIEDEHICSITQVHYNKVIV